MFVLYTNNTLDTMKPLNQGEEEIFSVFARTKYGNGVIIVTNFGLAVHTRKTGAILDLLYPEIINIKYSRDDKLRIQWKEFSNKNNSLDITTKESDKVYERMCAAKAEFDGSFSSYNDPVDWQIDTPTRELVRSKRVPSSVPDKFVWHDCWFDEARKIYVTLNPYFVRNDDLRKRPHQIKYQDQTGDCDGIVAKKEKIKIILGFPSVQIVKKGKLFYMLLPSLTREMVTAEIAAARHAPAAGQQRIDYFLI
ncbi:MAG: hypothetical protein K8823_191 [Cenarchaeum symbiont of Oopsacas minuta]|nr:hypothetical protein [Cenarchaeum symbiont of Oopsacas minuta]